VAPCSWWHLRNGARNANSLARRHHWHATAPSTDPADTPFCSLLAAHSVTGTGSTAGPTSPCAFRPSKWLLQSICLYGIDILGYAALPHTSHTCPLPPQNLDFDFEKCCSVSLSPINVYVCLVCGKYFQVGLVTRHCPST
jgi:hypothetical protein